MSIAQHCCDPRRLDVLRNAGGAGVNAIEFIEVLDRAAPAGVPRQRTLLLRLLRPGFALVPAQIVIAGGERIRDVGVAWAAAGDALPALAEPALAALLAASDEPARTLVVRTTGEGDFSRYTLALVAAPGVAAPPPGFDPVLSRVDFSFKVECPSDFDCADDRLCPPGAEAAPTIDYLAKDYPGLRRLMLDRLSLRVPGWAERSSADVGVALVELLAYAADNLSYRQDAIANEAYLATARRRVSVRRHARLVDYHLHDGCNARAWVQVQVAGGGFVLARGSRLFTRTPGATPGLRPGSDAERRLREGGALVFEVARSATLDERCNRIPFYTWGDAACCLPVGTTTATLRGRPPLAAGDVLVFEEIASPTTADEAAAAADADRGRRWAVRLLRVLPDADPSGGLFDTPPSAAAVEVTRIEWERADALPFALTLGASAFPGRVISVARGNIVLADHGETRGPEVLPAVPAATRRFAAPARLAGRCEPPAATPRPVRFRPALAQAPVTHGFDLETLLDALPGDAAPFWPASLIGPLDARHALPQVRLQRQGRPDPWTAAADLLASGATALQFVVETEHDGRSRLRFGDDRHGLAPNEGDVFEARYRVGNGAAGNVGAEAIAHLLLEPAVYAAAGAALPDAARVLAVRNPLAATGGTEPEDIEAARRDAPQAFRTQERAVTAADYAAAAERSGEVQRAAATFRWTGSWHTVFVTADRPRGAAVDAAFEARLRRHLERFRMAGYDLEVDTPRFVALDVALHVCARPGHFRAPLLRAVRQRLSAQRLGDGTLGLFHPDNFSFGEPVVLSRIVAAVQAIEGVEAVRVKRFQRLVGGSPSTLDNGVVPIGRLEIAQLEQNPSFPERGVLEIEIGGGQ